jgi:PIN domain nuclease of toxin-antitoxin system
MGKFMSLVLDTCALIWWSLDQDQLSLSAQKACDNMENDKNGLVASISIWEIAIKIKNAKRISARSPFSKGEMFMRDFVILCVIIFTLNSVSTIDK